MTEQEYASLGLELESKAKMECEKLSERTTELCMSIINEAMIKTNTIPLTQAQASIVSQCFQKANSKMVEMVCKIAVGGL